MGDKPDQKQWQTLTAVFLSASVLLFLGSLTQEAYHLKRNSDNPLGFELLLLGWMGPFIGMLDWFANPALLMTWYRLRPGGNPQSGLGVSMLSLGLALRFLFRREIMVDEAGHYAEITGLGIGYWLWIASILAALIACIAEIRILSDREEPQDASLLT